MRPLTKSCQNQKLKCPTNSIAQKVNQTTKVTWSIYASLGWSGGFQVEELARSTIPRSFYKYRKLRIQPHSPTKKHLLKENVVIMKPLFNLMVFHLNGYYVKKKEIPSNWLGKAKTSIQRMKIYLLAKKWRPCQWMETPFDLALRNSWHRKTFLNLFEAIY
jgi:hypothetical protein